MFQGVLIPSSGKPEIININLNDIESVIKCQKSSGCAIYYLDFFGYKTSLFYNDRAWHSNLNKNPLASLLLKEKGPVYGDTIIIDDCKNLVIDDLKKIVEISKVIPNMGWLPEPLIDELEQNSDEFDFNVKDIIKLSGSKELREEIWNKIGKYYVPDEDDYVPDEDDYVPDEDDYLPSGDDYLSHQDH